MCQNKNNLMKNSTFDIIDTNKAEKVQIKSSENAAIISNEDLQKISSGKESVVKVEENVASSTKVKEGSSIWDKMLSPIDNNPETKNTYVFLHFTHFIIFMCCCMQKYLLDFGVSVNSWLDVEDVRKYIVGSEINNYKGYVFVSSIFPSIYFVLILYFVFRINSILRYSKNASITTIFAVFLLTLTLGFTIVSLSAIIVNIYYPITLAYGVQAVSVILQSFIIVLGVFYNYMGYKNSKFKNNAFFFFGSYIGIMFVITYLIIAVSNIIFNSIFIANLHNWLGPAGVKPINAYKGL
ncbi:hypothetical protein NEIG_02180 [Nematocida sp. ERTm5]|nr:hypothetical protein NEIG_02180 [Nematocida sp. ERTm5]